MAISILFKSPGVTTDASLPTVKADGLLNAGSLFLLDFLRLGSWNPATDTVADGAAVRNLVLGAPSATLKIPATGDLTFVTGKGFQLRATTALGRVQVGNGTDYFQSNLGNDFVITTWVTYPDVDPTTGSGTGFILTKGLLATYNDVGPTIASRYVNGGDGTVRMDSSATNNGNPYTAKGNPAGKHQHAVAKVGANTLYFRDGVLMNTSASNTPALAANANPLNFGNGGAANQFAVTSTILHRAYAENLTISGLTAAAVVAADYAANSARFSG